jgi:hypothetical protein
MDYEGSQSFALTGFMFIVFAFGSASLTLYFGLNLQIILSFIVFTMAGLAFIIAGFVYVLYKNKQVTKSPKGLTNG